ncbi:MAG: hypothetical protein AB8D78_03885 [Akkermansiaceae bacterium]
MSGGKRKLADGSSSNRKRKKHGAYEGFSTVNRVAREKAKRRLGQNRKLNRRGQKSVWASIAMEESIMEEDGESGFFGEVLKFLFGLLLLPLAWVTTWTFLETFSHATLNQGFWQSPQFWYFAIGALVMAGWFFSKLGQAFFLYLYVFGHELTHAAFVKCFGGKVLEIKWSSEGGYVTTDKTNWVIALSPYFLPFWSVIAVICYVSASLFWEILPVGNHVFYASIGATWAFHLAWTLWMIPRDQPDLSETGTFLSLVLIYFGNLVVLIALLCFSTPHPIESLRQFGYSWVGTAITWGDKAVRWLDQYVQTIPGFFS